MKSLLHLSIDSEILARIKQKDFGSVSGFVENLFKVELGLPVDSRDNDMGELKIMNAQLISEVEKKDIMIKNLKKQIKENPKKDTKERNIVWRD